MTPAPAEELLMALATLEGEGDGLGQLGSRMVDLVRLVQNDLANLRERNASMRSILLIARDWYSTFAEGQEPQEHNGMCPGNISKSLVEAIDAVLANDIPICPECHGEGFAIPKVPIGGMVYSSKIKCQYCSGAK